MFELFTEAVESTLTIGEKLITLDVPTKREIAKLADTGLTVVAIASAVGVSVEIVEAVLDNQ